MHSIWKKRVQLRANEVCPSEVAAVNEDHSLKNSNSTIEEKKYCQQKSYIIERRLLWVENCRHSLIIQRMPSTESLQPLYRRGTKCLEKM